MNSWLTSFIRILLFLPLFITGNMAMASTDSSLQTDHVHAYRDRVSFTEEAPVSFPDFTITYLGKEVDPIKPDQKLTMTRYVFEAVSADEQQRVKWSSGLGEIGPQRFEIAGKKYMLELKRSIFFDQWLPEDVFVISREPEYVSKKKESYAR